MSTESTETTDNSDNVLASVMTLDDNETATIEAIVKDRKHVSTESYIWGEFTAQEIDELREQGFIITVHNVPSLSTPVDKDVCDATTGREIYTLGLRGPWLWADELEALGVTAIEKIGDTEYRVSMPGPSVGQVAQLYFVYSIHQKTLSSCDFGSDDAT
jgi:hypothetical protein